MLFENSNRKLSNSLIILLRILFQKVKILTEAISVPRSLLKELYEHLAKIEEILATLEELENKEKY
jgi:hypothetical protein